MIDLCTQFGIYYYVTTYKYSGLEFSRIAIEYDYGKYTWLYDALRGPI